MRDYYLHEESYAARMREEVMPYLAARRTDGVYPGFDGNFLHYVLYRADGARGAVVISHGFTDSCEKYHEMTYYFLREGWNVWIPEHRGHGTSYRAVENPTVTHVGHFEDYVKDFDIFLRGHVFEEAGPYFLYAHSMGGAIGAMYMEAHPDAFRAAVLSAPMIAPARGGVPLFAAKALCRTFIAFGGSKKRIFVAGEYPGHEEFEGSCKTSRARFDEYEAIKRAHPEYQNYSPTYRWTLESLGVAKKILRKGRVEEIRTPTLVFCAGDDTVVLREEQTAFAARLQNGRLCEVPHAKHEIYASEDAVLHPYVEQTLNFFEEAFKRGQRVLQ